MKIRWVIRCNYDDETPHYRTAMRHHRPPHYRGLVVERRNDGSIYHVMLFKSPEEAAQEAEAFQRDWLDDNIHAVVVPRRVP